MIKFRKQLNIACNKTPPSRIQVVDFALINEKKTFLISQLALSLTYRMLAWIVEENLLEVWTADGEHDLVTLQQLAIARDRAIDQITAIEQRLKTRREVFSEFKLVPAQCKLFHDGRSECALMSSETRRCANDQFYSEQNKLIADKLIRLIIYFSALSSSSCYFAFPILFLHKNNTRNIK